MSEAIISRRGYTAEGKPELRTETITGTTTWTVPNSIKSNISVLIFGGGGGGGNGGGGGGGGGWMNNGEFNIAGGTAISITIGSGGAKEKSGGTTSFGAYLSANGGSGGIHNAGAFQHAGSGGSGGGGGAERGSKGGRGYQFGGGGGGGTNDNWNEDGDGGDGGTWGGGGAGAGSPIYGSGSSPNSRGNFANGGNGGTYGGGGYGPNLHGRGGQYGGNGGNRGNFPFIGNVGILSGAGTNTVGNESVDKNFWGNGSPGMALINSCFYLRNTDYKWANVNSTMAAYNGMTFQKGGGGGYGSNGGNVLFDIGVRIWDGDGQPYAYPDHLGGGGGGYGGDGGTYYKGPYGTYSFCGGGGGGGYGKAAHGGNVWCDSGGGGGGYFAKGGDGKDWSNGGGGGGGAYGPGGDGGKAGNFGGGGGGNAKGGGGICILQYYM